VTGGNDIGPKLFQEIAGAVDGELNCPPLIRTCRWRIRSFMPRLVFGTARDNVTANDRIGGSHL
jgi:hypothetical protein